MTIIIFTIIAVTPFACMKEVDKSGFRIYTVTILIEVTRQLLSVVTEYPVLPHRAFLLYKQKAYKSTDCLGFEFDPF